MASAQPPPPPPVSSSSAAAAVTAAATTTEGSSNSTMHPIPSSIIIVNEATPLLSNDQQLASGTLHTDTSFHFSSCIAFNTDEEQREKELAGLFLLIVSSLLFAGVSVVVKLLGKTFPSFEIVLFRASIQFPLGILGCSMLKMNPFGKKGVRRWILFRAVVSAIALSLFFYSLTKLPLIDATVIFFLGPIFKVMIGCIILNDNFTIVDGFYSIICFVGLVLVAKPSFLFSQITYFHQPTAAEEADEYKRSFAISCALAASLMSAMAYITVRKVGQGTHAMVHVVYFGFVASLISIVFLLLDMQAFVQPRYTWSEFYLLVFNGVLAFIGQYFLNKGLKLAPMGPVTLTRVTDVVFAFVFGVIIFKEIPGFYTMVGSLLVVSMVTTMSLHRWHREELRTAAIRRKRSKDRLVARQQQAQQQQQQQQEAQQEQQVS